MTQDFGDGDIAAKRQFSKLMDSYEKTFLRLRT